MPIKPSSPARTAKSYSFYGLIVSVMILFAAGVASPLAAADLKPLTEDELSNVTGEEGVRLNLNLNMSLESLNIEDADGAGVSGGVFQLGSGNLDAITIDNGIGLPAELKGFTFDSSGENELNFGFPSGDLTASIDKIYFSDPGGPGMGPLTFEDVNFGKTNLKVGPN